MKITQNKIKFILLLIAFVIVSSLSCSKITFAMYTLTPTTSPSTTPTKTATTTDIPTNTSTITRTILPTITQSPQPEWVTDFAQPILDSIIGRTPDFQDDFSDPSTIRAWRWNWSCAVEKSSIEYKNEEFYVTNSHVHRELIYSDFVFEIEGRFIENSRGHWLITFRDIEPSYGNEGKIMINDGGMVTTNLPGEKDYGYPYQGLSNRQENHLLIIVKGKYFALYVNDKPVLYKNADFNLYGEIWFQVYPEPRKWTSVTTVAFDNIRIWDISDITVTPPAP